MMANLLNREWRTAEGFQALRAFDATPVALAPTKGRTTCQPHGRPPLDPGGRGWRSREMLSRGSAAGTVFGDRCWRLLAYSSNRMGLQQGRILRRWNQGIARSSNSNLSEN